MKLWDGLNAVEVATKCLKESKYGRTSVFSYRYRVCWFFAIILHWCVESVKDVPKVSSQMGQVKMPPQIVSLSV